MRSGTRSTTAGSTVSMYCKMGIKADERNDDIQCCKQVGFDWDYFVEMAVDVDSRWAMDQGQIGGEADGCDKIRWVWYRFGVLVANESW